MDATLLRLVSSLGLLVTPVVGTLKKLLQGVAVRFHESGQGRSYQLEDYATQS
jgi:hypothetical protein